MEDRGYFTGTTEKSPVAYRVGEEMVFELRLARGGRPISCPIIRWSCEGDDGQKTQGEARGDSGQPLFIKTRITRPGFVHVFAQACDETGAPIEGIDPFEGGAGAELEKIACATQKPADFDAFWEETKSQIAEVPPEISRRPVSRPQHQGFAVFDLALECPGGAPVTGFLTFPEGAAEKSLAARVEFMGYGVFPTEVICDPSAIVLRINAHGIETAREPEYYTHLAETVLKEYGFDNQENQSPYTTYFRGMMQRAIASVRYIKSLPEWNGRELEVLGGSQGAFQAVIAAAQSTQVTRCSVHIPWFCDLQGTEREGRLRGWRPDFQKGLAYYDPALHALGITAHTEITAGLGDYICPPSGVVALYNHLRAEKTLDFIQNKTHHYDPPEEFHYRV